MIRTGWALRWVGVTMVVLVLSACTATSSPSALPSTGVSPDGAVPSQPEAVPVPFPLEATILELQAAMEAGDLTSLELIDFYLARIAAYEDAGPKLNAFILVNPKAREEASALDAERAISGPRGPLHGIGVVLKDNIGTADMPTTAGSLALAGFIPSEDAFQVRKLREAGAVIIGKTNLMEFADGYASVSSHGGQTLSPYDLSRDPGGSSGGSAVAVTSNFAAAGWGTDSCGSVRYPAAHNNLYALRPTEGLTSRSGLIPLSTTLDTMSAMARSVGDLAIVLDTTAGVDPADPTTVPVTASYLDAVDPNGLLGRRIGLLTGTVDPALDQLMTGAIADMRANGVGVVEVELPSEEGSYNLFGEFGFAMNKYLAGEPGAPVRTIREIADMNVGVSAVQEGLGYAADGVNPDSSEEYRAALAGRAVFRDAVVAIMDEQDLDAIAYPASRFTLPGVGEPYKGPFDCIAAGFGGLPALEMPIGFLPDGIPVGMELMGRPFAEPTLFAMAAGYEAHTSHRFLPPTTPPL